MRNRKLVRKPKLGRDKKLKDHITERGFIHNTYHDLYWNEFRIVQSSSIEPCVWIFGDTVKDGSSAILLTPEELKPFYKELKRIMKGRVKK